MEDNHYLFADFLDNETAYLAAQRTWRELAEQIAATHGHDLAPYMDLAQGGRPVRDGNPLLALRAPATGRGIRIIQTAPDEPGGNLWAWLGTFGTGEATETHELVIDIQATPTTLAVAAILIERWFAGGLDAEALARWLAPWAGEEEE